MEQLLRRLAHASLPIAALALLPSAARAQSFNLDVGDTGFPKPADTFGAAAGQTGHWEQIDFASTGPLTDVSGAATAVTVSFGAGYNFTSNQACTTGDDEALLDDIIDPGVTTILFSGLADGAYSVYTYAMAPDNTSFVTNVTVVGSPDGTQGVGGDFCGGYVQGATHALHAVDVSGGALQIDTAVGTSFASLNGIQIVKEGGSGAPGCFGDGGGNACPCGNPGQTGQGCANSTGLGAQLAGSGDATVAADTLVLQAAHALPNQPGLFFQGDNQTNGGIGFLFGDGLRCCGMNVVRIQVALPDANGDAATTIGIAAKGGASPGDVKCYQYWYRDPSGGPCGNGFNLTNSWVVTWN